ncbi:biotin-dependent carboxyltransferase family protein [Rufibacter immobilis]|uniref:Biotin-dependent carboxyltransferase family protein n=1 Tax=Rufibacter immobilis TaxID=1348778 RepID=A0A3M9MX74_9BACT|nr:biotin-dependent carboxyltransferase family protein [Rufibacter immobilis]RNI30152.1 biotin-dependent carboxyltransferase family protein [Rufibacter immobilis]
MSIKITKPGLLTTLQDLGRYGYQKQGMVVSGTMDKFALRLANLLVGNPENAAALEISLMGPKVVFQEDQVLALTGANLSPRLNGKAVPMNRPVYVKKGTVLEFGPPVQGSWAYLAVAGGFEVPLVMGSAATYGRAGLGGWQGRALQKNDVLPFRNQLTEQVRQWPQKCPPEKAFLVANWSVSPQILPTYQENPTVRVLPGPEYDLFTSDSKAAFWQTDFHISTASDRMGYRTEGPVLRLNQPVELLSGAVTFGTVQVPSSGNPIILMAEHQTTGGYPRIGQVITADLPVLAQARPGSRLRFLEVSLDQAQTLYCEQEQDLERLQSALSLQLKKWTTAIP